MTDQAGDPGATIQVVVPGPSTELGAQPLSQMHQGTHMGAQPAGGVAHETLRTGSTNDVNVSGLGAAGGTGLDGHATAPIDQTIGASIGGIGQHGMNSVMAPVMTMSMPHIGHTTPTQHGVPMGAPKSLMADLSAAAAANSAAAANGANAAAGHPLVQHHHAQAHHSMHGVVGGPSTVAVPSDASKAAAPTKGVRRKLDDKSGGRGPNKKAKKKEEVTVEMLADPNYVHTWDEKGPAFKSGKFSKVESETLQRAIAQYAVNHEIDQSVLFSSEAHKHHVRGAWQEIAKCLPTRTLNSIFNHAKRCHHPNVTTGAWSEQDVQSLASLVAMHGHAWSDIGKILNRVPNACRDKWREMDKAYATGAWSKEEKQRLRELVEEAITERGGELTEFPMSRAELPWGQISSRLGNRSARACRVKWYDTVNPALKRHRTKQAEWTRADDYRLVSRVMEQGVSDVTEIEWYKISPEWSSKQCLQKWNCLVKELPNGGQGLSFSQTLAEVNKLLMGGSNPMGNGSALAIMRDDAAAAVVAQSQMAPVQGVMAHHMQPQLASQMQTQMTSHAPMQMTPQVGQMNVAQQIHLQNQQYHQMMQMHQQQLPMQQHHLPQQVPQAQHPPRQSQSQPPASAPATLVSPPPAAVAPGAGVHAAGGDAGSSTAAAAAAVSASAALSASSADAGRAQGQQQPHQHQHAAAQSSADAPQHTAVPNQHEQHVPHDATFAVAAGLQQHTQPIPQDFSSMSGSLQ